MAASANRAKRQPHWLNQEQMAAACGISVKSFAQWRVEPVAKIGRCTYYLVSDVLANREARLERGRQPAVEPTPGELDAEKEKVLLTREQRIGQELKNAQTRRELAPVPLIDWTLSKVGAQIAAILDSIPLKVKKMLPRITATEIEHIKRELVKAQNAAARVTVDLDDYYEGDAARNREGN